MERAAKTKINICRVDENSPSFQAGCLEEFGCFSSLLFSTLGALYLLPESVIHCAYSLSYRLKTEGIVKMWIAYVLEFDIHHVVVHLLHTLSCDLLYCTSLVPLCMWVLVCVCLCLIDASVSQSLLLLPRADKWWPASPPPPRIPCCLWLVSLLCIDVET